MLNLRAGELVEVLSKEEILATLDPHGRYENMPFMPEMYQYCGKRLRVFKRSHKTCDFVTNTGIRSVSDAVHLEDSRCDGSAHGGCQARCTIYWKEAWLKRVPENSTSGNGTAVPVQARSKASCTEQIVNDACCASRSSTPSEVVYSCQATQLPKFTEPLSPWNLGPYIEDYKSGNVPSLTVMLPRFCYRMYDNLINLGIGWGPVLRFFYDLFQKVWGGLPYPARSGNIPTGGRTPGGSTGLQPGDVVRVKSYEEILKTLDEASKNRGMIFSPEMVPYCGQQVRVLSRVTNIIEEKTGKMLEFKNPCIILEGVICKALYNKRMIFCPRATYPYWREIWLERVTVNEGTAAIKEEAKSESMEVPAPCGSSSKLCQIG